MAVYTPHSDESGSRFFQPLNTYASGAAFDTRIVGGADQGLFTIWDPGEMFNGVPGQAGYSYLTLNWAAWTDGRYDFESPLDSNRDSVYVVEVERYDSGGVLGRDTFMFHIDDVQPEMSFTLAPSIDEWAINGTKAVTVSASDGSGTVKYVLVDDAGGRFQIDAITGIVTVRDQARIDYEGGEIIVDGSHPSRGYTVVVGALEGADTSPSSTIEIAIPVEDITEPEAVAPSGNQDIDALLWGHKWGQAFGDDYWEDGRTTLRYSFATSSAPYTEDGYGDIVGFAPLSGVQKAAYAGPNGILSLFSEVSGLVFVEDDFAPDIRIANASRIAYQVGDTPDRPGGNANSGEASPPDPTSTPQSWGDIWLSNDPGDASQNINPASSEDPVRGNYEFTTLMMHELGHAVGLKHGHEDWTTDGGVAPALPADHNSQEFSIMTYNNATVNPEGSGSADQSPTTLMQNDIAALQYLYGANYLTRAEDTRYHWDKATGELSVSGNPTGVPFANKVFMTVWDGGGEDMFDFLDYDTAVSVDLRPGAFSTFAPLVDLHSAEPEPFLARGNVATALLYRDNPASLIENARGGSANDSLAGNQVANKLYGNAGRDTLFGFEGDDLLDGGGNPQTGADAGGDVMYGGAGNDTYIVDSAFDYIDEGFGPAGALGLGGLAGDVDLVRSTAYFWWDYFSVAEELVIEHDASTVDVSGVDIGVTTIVAGAYDSQIRGNEGNNNIYANWGSDTVWAGAGTDHIDFADRLAGATGAKTLVYEDGNGYDIVWNFMPGTDTLDISATGVSDFAALLALGHDDGIGNSYFDLGDADYLYIIGKTLADLGADSFAFA